MTHTEVVSGPTTYEDMHLLLEYDKGEISLYDLPAGRKEEGEEAPEGMMREFKEETGLSILDVDSFTALRPYTYVMDNNTFQVYPFNIELTDRKDLDQLDRTEHDGYEWVTQEELDKNGKDGWLNSPKFFNVKYAEAAINGREELRGNSGEEERLVFREDEVMDNLDSLEDLIGSKLG